MTALIRRPGLVQLPNVTPLQRRTIIYAFGPLLFRSRRQAERMAKRTWNAKLKARGECDRLICAAAALRGDPIPKGSALDGARQVELMAHGIERRSGGAA